MQQNTIYHGNGFHIDLCVSGEEEFYDVIFPTTSWIELNLDDAILAAEKYKINGKK